MRLKVLLPTEVLVDEDADSLVVTAGDGSLGLEPGHADFVSALVPGIVAWRSDGRERLLAADTGVLVKQGGMVLVSVRDGVRGEELPGLERVVADKYRQLDEKERKARAALARLEADLVRRMLELERH